jgi:hypothetical protein
MHLPRQSSTTKKQDLWSDPFASEQLGLIGQGHLQCNAAVKLSKAVNKSGSSSEAGLSLFKGPPGSLPIHAFKDLNIHKDVVMQKT